MRLIESEEETYLVTIVPPVATAVINRNVQNSQNHGANAVAIPDTSWIKTAITSGPRRPYLVENQIKSSFKKLSWFKDSCYNTYLSANGPKIMLPTKMPSITINCDALASWPRWHTKFHVICMVSVNVSRSKWYDLQSAEHLSVTFGVAHV